MSDLDALLAAAATTDEPGNLTAELVAIKSLPGEEERVQRHVAAWLTANGLEPETVPVTPNRPNVLATVRNGDGPTLLLNGHVDTAIMDPRWNPDRVWGQRDGDRLYGLGACDMKAGVAAAMLATRALASATDLWRGTVIFSSVVDEEAYSIGARAPIESGIRADYCVVTESSWVFPSIASFGKVLVRIDVTGEAAHASWKGKGINAAVEASRLVARLGEVPMGVHPRIEPNQCVLSMRAGSDVYESITVPDRARITINWHTVPGESGDDVLARIQALIDDLHSPASFALTIDPPYYPAWETPIDHPLVATFGRAYDAEAGRPPTYGYMGYGDMNLFSTDAGIPTLMFGPHGASFHAADEWVDVPSIAATVRVLLRLTCALLPAGA